MCSNTWKLNFPSSVLKKNCSKIIFNNKNFKNKIPRIKRHCTGMVKCVIILFSTKNFLPTNKNQKSIFWKRKNYKINSRKRNPYFQPLLLFWFNCCPWLLPTSWCVSYFFIDSLAYCFRLSKIYVYRLFMYIFTNSLNTGFRSRSRPEPGY